MHPRRSKMTMTSICLSTYDTLCAKVQRGIPLQTRTLILTDAGSTRFSVWLGDVCS